MNRRVSSRWNRSLKGSGGEQVRVNHSCDQGRVIVSFGVEEFKLKTLRKSRDGDRAICKLVCAVKHWRGLECSMNGKDHRIAPGAEKRSPLIAALALVGWVLLTFCAPAFGIFGMPGEWYAGLNKPSWNPPSWVFGPVWSALYTLMAVAAWLVWSRGGWKTQGRALTLYLGQLVLNAAWTPLFFGLHRPDLALIDITALFVMIVATMVAFFKVHRVAGLLLLPYLLWVGFASVLNFTLWWMNRL